MLKFRSSKVTIQVQVTVPSLSLDLSHGPITEVDPYYNSILYYAFGSINYQMLCCPMKRLFYCDCQSMPDQDYRTSKYVSLEMREPRKTLQSF